MYIMCVCFFSTLSHRVGALQMSIIISSSIHEIDCKTEWLTAAGSLC